MNNNNNNNQYQITTSIPLTRVIKCQRLVLCNLTPLVYSIMST